MDCETCAGTCQLGDEIVIVQVALIQAFDRILHSSIARALYAKGAPRELIAATCTNLRDLRCRIRLGNTISDWVQQDHGVPHGAPASPAMFVHTTDAR